MAARPCVPLRGKEGFWRARRGRADSRSAPGCGDRPCRPLPAMPAAEEPSSGLEGGEPQYLQQVRHILQHGHRKEDRTGTGTISVFGMQARYSLRGRHRRDPRPLRLQAAPGAARSPLSPSRGRPRCVRGPSSRAGARPPSSAAPLQGCAERGRPSLCCGGSASPVDADVFCIAGRSRWWLWVWGPAPLLSSRDKVSRGNSEVTFLLCRYRKSHQCYRSGHIIFVLRLCFPLQIPVQPCVLPTCRSSPPSITALHLSTLVPVRA